MPKKAKELTALEIKHLTTKGKYAIGSGIYLEVNSPDSKAWILRIMVGDKRRHIGLGGYPTTSLAKARERAQEMRGLINQGTDPIEHKKKITSAIRASQAREVTFKQCAIAYIDAHSNSWKNKRTQQSWPRSLEMYAYPVMGNLLVKDIEQSHILQILKPIWNEKTETARRVRNRIETVLDYAAVSGYRDNDNPARWKGRLDKILPSPSKITKVQPQKALSIDEIPAFIKQLKAIDSMGAKCLEFLILTACRSGEARGAVWEEIDLKEKVWTIPSERMKADREHQVPLSDQAVALLKSIPKLENVPYIFFSQSDKPLSDMTLSMLMRRMEVDAVPHGFRSTFRDWAGDCTNYPRDIAEAALAHTLTNKVEAAYRRGTALEKRREMMQEWAEFIFSRVQ